MSNHGIIVIGQDIVRRGCPLHHRVDTWIIWSHQPHRGHLQAGNTSSHPTEVWSKCGTVPLLFLKVLINQCVGERKWRRGWDSNPRYPCGYNGFRDRPVRPLRHLSTLICYLDLLIAAAPKFLVFLQKPQSSEAADHIAGSILLQPLFLSRMT